MEDQKFAIFKQAEKNLLTNPTSQIDNFIVDLWYASKNLYEKNVKLQEALDASESQRRFLAGRVDMLETRKAKEDGALPHAAEWLASLVTRPQV